MPTNKNALLRYHILDKCFRNTGRRYFIEDLIGECNRVLSDIDPLNGVISRRQVFEDIRFMESGEGWSVDLVRERVGKRISYRYEDSSFSIHNAPLSEVEFTGLEMVMTRLAGLRGIVQFDLLRDIFDRLNFRSAPDRPVIGFDHNPYLAGIDMIPAIYNAVTYRQVLSVEYLPFDSDEPLRYVIHPYFLRQYNNRWFLFGFNPETGRHNWNLALDRIRSIELLTDRYHENDAIDWNEYFDNIIGVTKYDGAEEMAVVLHFSGESGRYVETKPIHETQRSRRLPDGVLEVKLEIMHNPELENVIMSFGEKVQVISPASLRDRIRDRLERALNAYVRTP